MKGNNAMSQKKTKLAKYIETYRKEKQEPISDGYVRQLEIAVVLLNRYAKKKVKLKHLSDDLLNGYLEWLAANGRSPETVRGKRSAIIALWRAAFMAKILDKKPERVKIIRARKEAPKAWRPNEVARLKKAALDDDRVFPSGIRRGPWFASLISAAYDSGLRLGDLLRLTVNNIPDTGVFVVNQHKTRRDVTVRFKPETLELIAESLSDGRDSPIVWPLWAGRGQFYVAFKALVSLAAIRSGTFKFLRRSAITAVEVKGGNSSAFAGHKNRNVTVDHYIDPTQIELTVPDSLE